MSIVEEITKPIDENLVNNCNVITQTIYRSILLSFDYINDLVNFFVENQKWNRSKFQKKRGGVSWCFKFVVAKKIKTSYAKILRK